MKILFVSTSIPPATDMHTIRNMYLIQALLNAGDSIDVITCGEEGEIDKQHRELLKNTSVIRTPLPNVLKWHKYINRTYGGLIKKAHNVAINYIAVPDLYILWDRVAWKAITKYKLYDYDLMITSSGSYTSHIVGCRWKNKTGKKWIAEYGDPWGLDEMGRIRKMNRCIEQRIVSKCDGFVFTTQETIDAYQKSVRKEVPYKLITGGFEQILDDIANHSKMLTFVYTGIAYKKSRNLQNLMHVIGDNPSATELNMVGTLSDNFKMEAEKYKNINVSGRVTYGKSLELIASSDVLVHIGNYGTLQVPGKTYIYLSSKKPILYIQQQEKEDPTAKLLSRFSGTIICKNQLDDIGEAVSFIIENYSRLKQDAETRQCSEEIKSFYWKKLGKEFCEFVHSL